jgi:hypothetical protein
VSKTSPSEPVQFTDEALANIAAKFPAETPPERKALLPLLLRAWAKEDLREHLSREGRAVAMERRRELAAAGDRARNLLNTLEALDEHARFLLAVEPQLRHEARTSSPRWADLGLTDDTEAGERRRDDALSWLRDLADAFAKSPAKLPSDKRTRSYLVVLDLAAIFELVTCMKPTRRNNPYADSQAYGPFWEFVSRVCAPLNRVRSLDRAIRDVLTFYPTEYSPFVANLQFRHPGLWQKFREQNTEA